MSKLEVISLSGKLKTGKDYLYEKYLYPRGYMRWALADHFKIFIVGQGLASYEDVFQTKPLAIRHLLQQAGTEQGRNVYGDKIWIDVTFTWLQHLSNTLKLHKWCITDCRFKNEVDGIQERGGKVIRIVAPERDKNSGASPEARNHISETDLDDYPIENFDGLLFNDPSQSHTVAFQIASLLGDSPAYDANEEEEEDVIPRNRVSKALGDLTDMITKRLSEF